MAALGSRPQSAQVSQPHLTGLASKATPHGHTRDACQSTSSGQTPVPQKIVIRPLNVGWTVELDQLDAPMGERFSDSAALI